MSTTIAQNGYSPGFFDRIDQFINSAVETVSEKYQQLEAAAPNVIAIAKKVLPFALLLLSLIINPIATLVGLGIGLAFSRQLEPIITKIQNSVIDSFKNSSLFGKILMCTGAAFIGIMLPSSIQGGLMGISGGIHIKNTAAELANPQPQ